MNPQHAQFFRELRELLGKHNVKLFSMGELAMRIKFMRVNWPVDTYTAYEIKKDTKYFSGDYYLDDVPQKDGE